MTVWFGSTDGYGETGDAQSLLAGGADDDVDNVAANVQPTGKVVGIVKRNWRQYCGVLLPSDKKTSRHLFVQ